MQKVSLAQKWESKDGQKVLIRDVRKVSGVWEYKLEQLNGEPSYWKSRSSIQREFTHIDK